MPELVATTPDQYVALAAGLARDVARLAGIRSGLRERMERSPLMDAPRFARHLEAAYREMWRRWCARG
jgi:predicted O-linked N-acetylglucosamine transferase (SPINDLY family)